MSFPVESHVIFPFIRFYFLKKPLQGEVFTLIFTEVCLFCTKSIWRSQGYILVQCWYNVKPDVCFTSVQDNTALLLLVVIWFMYIARVTNIDFFLHSNSKIVRFWFFSSHLKTEDTGFKRKSSRILVQSFGLMRAYAELKRAKEKAYPCTLAPGPELKRAKGKAYPCTLVPGPSIVHYIVGVFFLLKT